MYFNLQNELSHNCYIMMILGARGCGKSWACKKFVLRRFLDYNEQFIVLNRTEVDKDETMDSYFNDVSLDDEFIECDIKFEGDTFLVNDRMAGTAHALSKAHTYKRSSFPRVSWIIFEEFTADVTIGARYLKNEFELYLNYLDTIIRNRDNVKIFMIGNYVSLYCPYVNGWDLYPKHETQAIVKTPSKKIMLHILEDDLEFVNFRKKTLMGQIHEESGTAKHGLYNTPKIDNDVFIQKKTENCSYLFTFTYEGEKLGCWADWDKGLYFISFDIDPTCKIVYATTLNDHQPNAMLLKRKKSSMFSGMIKAYERSSLRFESLKIKLIMDNVIKMTF